MQLLRIESKAASYGIEVLATLEEPRKEDKLPMVIVTDAIMPNMGGIELIEKIKQSDALKYIPIIVLTTEQFFCINRKKIIITTKTE